MRHDQNSIRGIAHQWRSQIDDGGLSSDQQQAFEQWLAESPEHVEAFAEADMLWGILGEVKHELPQAQIYSRHFLVRVKDYFYSLWQPGLPRFASATVAALMLFGITWFMHSEQHPQAPNQEAVYTQAIHHRSNFDEIKTLTLSDNSVITLGRSSHIDVAIDEYTRAITLHQGSAYFDVQHDGRPFVISSGGAQVKVLGTQFDLQRKGNTLYVGVEEGAVSVSHAFASWQSTADTPKAWKPESGIKQRLELTANQGVKVSQRFGVGKATYLNPEHIGAWRNNTFIYVNAQLHEVVADLRRLSDKTIHLDNKARQLELSGSFNSTQFDLLLDTLEASLPVYIEVTHDSIHIKKSN